jgi:hypothetical protein
MLTRRIIPLALAGLAGLALLAPVAARAEAPLPLRKATVGAATSWFAPDVSPDELRWPAPPTDGMKNAPIFGYAHRWKPGQPIPNAERVQMPLYRNFDSDDPKWWDQQLDELLFTRPPLIFLIGRGCTKPEDRNAFAGPGNMCPYKLRMMVDAVRRNAAEDAARFALFVDTGGTFALRRAMTRNGPERLDDARSSDRDPNTRFDLSDTPDSSGRTALWYFWDATMKPWFDTVPKEMWYRIDDAGTRKPVIAFWGITHRFTGHRGNTTKLLADLKAKFVERYGIEPFFILSTAWITGDPSLAERPDLVGGVHGWFQPRFGEPTGAQATTQWSGEKWQTNGTPNGISSLAEWNGRRWGVTIPGFDCGPQCNVPSVDRRDGKSFDLALRSNTPATINLIEGFNGPIEGTAIYRSGRWQTPNAYLEILRRWNDPASRSIRLQAEGADVTNASATPRSDNDFLPREGIVGDQNKGEWKLLVTKDQGFSFKRIRLTAGEYDITIRSTASRAPASLMVLLGAHTSLKATIIPPPDATTPVVQRIGAVNMPDGDVDISAQVITGELEIDWLMIRRRRY